MLPEGWTYANLGEIASTVTSGSRDWAQYYSDAGDKFVRMTNLSRDGVRISENDMKYVAIPPDSSDGKRTSLKNGDILISITAELGKIGLVPKGFGTAFINQHLALVRLKNGTASSPFVAYALSSKKLNQKLNSLNDAGAKAGLNLSTIRSFPLALPPLPEQKKIAAILSTWDRAIEGTEKLLANSQQQKKALMQQLLTGKKRLPGFTGEWKRQSFKVIFDVDNQKDTQTPASEYKEEGRTPIVDQGKSFISGYTDANTVYENVPVIIFGDHTRVIKWVDFPFSPGADGTQVLRTRANTINKFGYYLLQNVDLPNLGYSRHMKELKEQIFHCPPLPEQKAIAAVLSTADEEITAIESDLARLRQEKKALMQQLLTGKIRVAV
ncbi:MULTISPECIES: restriction endonuclease subunit S [Acetobacter]|uniref:restriction endonuclease subunit S n=1 Tax=Acetobacter TaxID=434 RepID=UPI000384341B|nr:restriction endonuclease subunit S [Acetobacter pasteurianus]CCT61058.1 restriction modification system DNA specificity subunit [Acetobacter pasteurianus 386B]